MAVAVWVLAKCVCSHTGYHSRFTKHHLQLNTIFNVNESHSVSSNLMTSNL